MNSLSIISGNILSILGMVCDSVSGTRKSTRSLLIFQSAGQVMYGLSSLVLKGYSGAVQGVVSILRNLAALCNVKSRKLEWALIILGVVFGLYFNNRGLVGLLPVIANTQYSVAIFRLKDKERALKLSFLLCIVLFSVFNFFIMNYAGIVTNGIVFVSTAMSLIKRNK